jgi:hypothetical protein
MFINAQAPNPSEPLKKRNLVLKDKSGRVIVPKDLLTESQNDMTPKAQVSAMITEKDLTPLQSLSLEQSFSLSNSDILLKQETTLEPCQTPQTDGLKDESPSNESSTPVSPIDPPQNLISQELNGDFLAEKRAKKNLKKDKLAAADLREGDILDAYTSVQEQISVLAPPLPPPSSTSSDLTDQLDDASDDDWETQASKLSEEVSLPVVRSLRPGGGEQKANPVATSSSSIVVYTKADLLTLRLGLELSVRPPQCLSYDKILFFGLDNQQIHRSVALRFTNSSQQGQAEKWKQPGSNFPQQNQSQSSHDNQKRHPNSRGAKRPVPPMPRKVITDPLEQMSRDVVAILNKITPQTFAKLTGKLRDIQIHNSAMLSKFVRLVFDKAVSEPNFANLYAEMCSSLDSANHYANFCHIVRNQDTNQYLWLEDIQYSNILAGPYLSIIECITACHSHIPPPTQLISHPVSIAEEVILNGNLISVVL